MSHPAQIKFCKYVRRKFPNHFRQCNVIDVGSLDINGNNRYLFSRSHYIGVDLHPGKNVDVVGLAHEVLPNLRGLVNPKPFWNPNWKRIEMIAPFDTIISTEALEHDQHYYWTLEAMYQKLRPGGLLVITCAGDGRQEHGTHAHHPESSPGTHDYYHNVSNRMFAMALPPALFDTYYLNQVDTDLQFFGIKSSTKLF